MSKKTASKLAKLSVILVHYQTELEILKCLASLNKATKNIETEIIVVDNGSQVGFQKKLLMQFPKVIYLKSPQNVGFGAGNNLGFAVSHGEYVFFLNPDTELQLDTVTHLLKYLTNHPQVGVVTPVLLNLQGKPYQLQGSQLLTPVTSLFAHSLLHRVWPHNPIAQRFWLQPSDLNSNRELEVVPGTAMMLPRSIFTQVGGFDERFFLYFEEFDLCRRIRAAGYSCVMVGEAKLTHAWGKSSQSGSANLSTQFYRESRWQYFNKYYGRWWATIIDAWSEFSPKKLLGYQ